MATGRHTISHAKNIFWGNAQYGPYQSGKRGVRLDPIVKVDLGVPAAADPNGLVTKQVYPTAAATFTFASSVTGASLSGTVKTLDVPRNVTITTSDADGLATFIIKGTDEYGVTMWERMAPRASDTVTSGKKAFKTITSLTLGAGSSGTFYMGFGDRLGLPYKLSSAQDVVQAHSGTNAVATDFSPSDFVLPTYSATESHSATVAVTGFAGLPRDVRGTWKAPDATDGTNNYVLWYKISDVDTKIGAFGIDQAKS